MMRTKEELRKSKKQKFLKVCETLRVCDSCEFKTLVMMGDRSNDKETVEAICGDCPNYKEMRIVGDELWETDTNIEAILEKRLPAPFDAWSAKGTASDANVRFFYNRLTGSAP